jgi:hypothetical protein
MKVKDFLVSHPNCHIKFESNSSPVGLIPRLSYPATFRTLLLRVNPVYGEYCRPVDTHSIYSDDWENEEIPEFWERLAIAEDPFSEYQKECDRANGIVR